eukprot:COSAG06_NODE_48457_length_332_cov_0.648069_1_plen_81_part_10
MQFPGAKYILVSFTEDSKLRQAKLIFYKDMSMQEQWWASASPNLPGTRGTAPLVVPADQFVLHFHSDARPGNIDASTVFGF